MEGSRNLDKITIYDIAAKAGVSASTVSRVINNYPYVKKATRDKVHKLLAENNYILNETARSLVTQSSHMAGILISDIRMTHHTEGVYYIEQEFSKRGYSCIIYNTGLNPESMALHIQMLSQKKIEALVLVGSIYQNETVKRAISQFIPSVPVAICNGYFEAPNVYGVVADECNGVMDCVRLLAEKGRKKICFIYYNDTPSNQQKILGFTRGCREFLSDDSSCLVKVEMNISKVENILTDFFSSHSEVDAVIFAEDFLALIGLHVLATLNKRIPDDIAVIGINNSKYACISNPSLTSLDNMLYDMSIMAVRTLLNVLDGDYGNKHIILGTRIEERNST